MPADMNRLLKELQAIILSAVKLHRDLEGGQPVAYADAEFWKVAAEDAKHIDGAVGELRCFVFTGTRDGQPESN